MRVLIFTPMYPTENDPHNGTFVYDEVESLRDLVPDIDVLYINTRESKTNYFKALSAFKKKIAEFQPDIVHCHHTFLVFVAWLAGFRNIILTFHEGEYLSEESYFTLVKREGIGKFLVLSKRFKRFCLKRVAHVFDITGALANWPDTTSPFFPGINPEIFHPTENVAAKQELGWDPEKKHILFPGNPNDSCKRFDIANTVLADVRARINTTVDLVPLINIDHDAVPVYMSACDVMLLVSDYEASPMVVKEAVACGLPCVCYDVGDVTTVLDGVPRSYVIQPDTVKAAELVSDILAPGDFERQNHLAEKYLAKNIAADIHSVYQVLYNSNE